MRRLVGVRGRVGGPKAIAKESSEKRVKQRMTYHTLRVKRAEGKKMSYAEAVRAVEEDFAKLMASRPELLKAFAR